MMLIDATPAVEASITRRTMNDDVSERANPSRRSPAAVANRCEAVFTAP
jgi:hypothetical protein